MNAFRVASFAVTGQLREELAAAKFFHVFQKILVTPVAGVQKIVFDMMVVGVIAMNTTTSPPINKRPLRRAFQAFMVLVVFVIGSFVVIALMPPKRLLAENFPQVRVGMTQSEVETLLGGRAGNYGKYPDGVFVVSNEAFVSTSGSISKGWCDDSHLFQIYFDAQGRVVAKYQQSSYQQLPGPPISHWKRFRRWIRLKTGW